MNNMKVFFKLITLLVLSLLSTTVHVYSQKHTISNKKNIVGIPDTTAPTSVNANIEKDSLSRKISSNHEEKEQVITSNKNYIENKSRNEKGNKEENTKILQEFIGNKKNE